ncbi:MULTISPECIES: HNH endonuclease [unclassified Mucilaginibacter]|uniref:HNH endonuclease n=1 Tax=unclassified Mucilaginibacter TaxID=2617802 RepID=UPI002AC8CE8B|nr:MULTISPECIES: HNH endonuclease [unclassified Mucilaginibacter]MEB0263697.1 HNH endonuclease [Mucilaginibacter sp. 10I4]MEB0280800.1 HNH endonuclease [Mucilaginibacter sp. 10B2]MEB0303220.1 HNH endonuclease [Mucilaginibacter sp. 5C4]WPX24342.1 HNH endonuclease [Mucilaginibacter sp. 5C4]
MKEGQTLWTKEQLLLAINLYSKIPFGKMSAGNAIVKEWALLIGRSPAAVARKLGNFASFDPKLLERGVKGLPNVSKLDREVWNEYMNNWDELFIESETLLAQKKHTTIEQLNPIELIEPETMVGREAIRQVVVRLDQTVFRKMVLSNFADTCCITGINQPELLIASHILPWSLDAGNRLNPRNGLALNNLHDKAFERGLITITEDLKIKVSSILMNSTNIQSIRENFIAYDGKSLIEPKKFFPDVEFLKIHNGRFKG